MISATVTTGLLEAITAGGGNTDQVLRSVGIDGAAFSNPEGFIPCSSFGRILEEAARATGDDCFGLHFAEHYNPKNIGPLIYAVLNAPSIAAGCENAARYLHIHNQALEMSVAVEKQRAFIRLSAVDPMVELSRQHREFGMAVFLNTIRLMAGSQWAPQEVQFTHDAPAQTSEHLRVFCAPVSFGHPADALIIDREFLVRHVPAADPRLCRILQRYLDRIVNEMPREDILLASVRKAVAESMRDGDVKLGPVAKKVALSPRTLQRRLKEYGVDFMEMVNDTRRRISLNYLRSPRHTLTEIAFLLGYSEVSAFNRAFKRWTGSTPMDYRRPARRGFVAADQR
jgi:AraC-like DNA-binding protein